MTSISRIGAVVLIALLGASPIAAQETQAHPDDKRAVAGRVPGGAIRVESEPGGGSRLPH